MTDKVQKISEVIEGLRKHYIERDDFDNGWNFALDKVLSLLDTFEEEPKECMYSKGNYTDEDRKVLCDGCEEECKYSESDDFTKALAECISQAQCSVVDPTAHAEIWKDELIKLSKCKEPVSEDLEEASKEWLAPQLDKSYVNYGEKKMMELTHFDGYAMLDAIEFGAKWQKAKDESTTEDLGECINELSKQFPEVSFAKLSRIAVRVAKWQRENLWKPADGDDLPEIDREVIAIVDYDFGHYKVVYAHRPNPNGWDGTNINTEEKEHFEPEIYDKGGWNQPHVLYWLDARLPYEENKIIK
jgi:hypothetical protein